MLQKEIKITIPETRSKCLISSQDFLEQGGIKSVNVIWWLESDLI